MHYGVESLQSIMGNTGGHIGKDNHCVSWEMIRDVMRKVKIIVYSGEYFNNVLLNLNIPI